MGRKNVVKSYQMFTDGDMSGSITSEITNVINQDQASIILDWAGATPVGEVQVEVQNGDDTTWRTIDFGTTMPVSGNTDTMRLVFQEMPFTAIRVQYIATSGTGTLNAFLTSKTVGA